MDIHLQPINLWLKSNSKWLPQLIGLSNNKNSYNSNYFRVKFYCFGIYSHPWQVVSPLTDQIKSKRVFPWRSLIAGHLNQEESSLTQSLETKLSKAFSSDKSLVHKGVGWRNVGHLPRGRDGEETFCVSHQGGVSSKCQQLVHAENEISCQKELRGALTADISCGAFQIKTTNKYALPRKHKSHMRATLQFAGDPLKTLMPTSCKMAHKSRNAVTPNRMCFDLLYFN